MLNFKNCISELIEIFDKKTIYQENKLFITRAIAYFVKNIFNNDLIDKKYLKKF